MGVLPPERVMTTAPFASTGVDIMGPFLCKLNGRASHKIYVAVFTCFETRSVHAEVVFKLDADSALNAIVRFCARRPGLTKLFSDRGTNFVASKSILEKELREVRGAAERQLAMRGIEWEMNPPHAAHRGGVWERVVGLFKKQLAGVSKGDVLHYDTFNTIIVEIEGILNRRPLTQISTDSRDTEALTPNHFLAPATASASTEPVVNSTAAEAETARSSWKRAQSRINAFWKVFKTEYLSLLHSRCKWRKSKEDLKEGDLVLLVDETAHRNQWKLGRVEKIHQNGPHVRRVDVRRGDQKTVTRDRTKIVKLEMD